MVGKKTDKATFQGARTHRDIAVQDSAEPAGARGGGTSGKDLLHLSRCGSVLHPGLVARPCQVTQGELGSEVYESSRDGRHRDPAVRRSLDRT